MSTGRRPAFTAGACHLADGRDLLSIIISGGGRFQLDGGCGEHRFGKPWRSGPRKPQRQRAAFARRQHRLDHLHGPRAAGAAARRDYPSRCSAACPATIPACACSMPISRRCSRCEQEWDLALVTLHIRDLALERARRARRGAGAGARTRRAGGAAEPPRWRRSTHAPASPVSTPHASRPGRPVGALSAPVAGIDRTDFRGASAGSQARLRGRHAARWRQRATEDQRDCIAGGILATFPTSTAASAAGSAIRPHGVRVRAARRRHGPEQV